MLRAITAAISSASAAPGPVREARAAAASANATSRPSGMAPVEVAAPQAAVAVNPQIFRYNSSEFIYRQDIGRIVLIGQSPVTGERKSQIPSEEALRAYERTMRAEELRSLLADATPAETVATPAPTQAPTPTPTPRAPALPSLSRALSAALGGDEGSGVVSVSA